MISVGLDVSRFNTIIMNSMPRNIAEYIQASSRVAREQKGLVLTLHNPFRSRDVSHYEKFREFHEKLYFYVEPISITPFSKKSVEKYLALYLAAIVRHSYDKLADRNSASKINESNLSDQIKQMVADYFNQRYDRMQKPEISQLEKGLLTPELRDNIIRFVDEAIGQWEAKANEVDGLVYNSTQYQNAAALFSIPAGYDNSNGDNLWTVPQSLRIVEPEAVLHIRVGNDGN
jgi:superfamily II DNA/RNA helicase